MTQGSVLVPCLQSFQKTLKPIRRQSRVAHRRGNGAVPWIVLDGSGVVGIVGECVAAGMAQHVAVNEECEPGCESED